MIFKRQSTDWLALVLLGTIFVAVTGLAQAADIAVDGTGCSLADAITAANTDSATGGCTAGEGADTLTLSADITLGAALPVITAETIIEGDNHTVSGDDTYPIFIVENADLTVNNATLRDGSGINGGAVYIEDGILIINNVNITENFARDHGGGIYATNGIAEIKNDSEITKNSAGDTAGGIYFNNTNVTIVNSEVSENTTTASGGGGIYFTSGIGSHALGIMTSTFKKNTAAVDGGALRVANGISSIVRSSFTENTADDGAGIKSYNTTLTIENTTISTNTARLGAGLNAMGSHLTLTHVTLAYNTATEHGGGLLISGAAGSLKIRNSLITGTVSGGDCDSGPNEDMITENVGNLIQDGSCAPSAVVEKTATPGVQEDETSTSQIVRAIAQQEEVTEADEADEEEPVIIDARLGDLTGDAAYHPLRNGSPAIDMAVEEYCLEVDQPGTPRPQGGICDVGAYELPVIIPTKKPPPTQQPIPTEMPATEAPTEEPTATATAVNCVHVVAAGDNLFRVALMYGRTVEALQELNRLSGDTVAVGQELVVPDCEVKPPECNGLPDDVIFDPESNDVGCLVVEISDIDKHPLMNAGIIIAFDVWGKVAEGVTTCFSQGGSIVFMDKSTSPPDVTRLATYQSDGKMCARVDRPGTIVLVAPLTEESSIPLTECQVTATDVVHLRNAAGGEVVLSLIPYNVSLDAKARTAGWYNVVYLGMDGWISADFVSTQGNCG